MKTIWIIVIVVVALLLAYYFLWRRVERYSANTEEQTTLNQLKTVLIDINPDFRKLSIVAGNESLTINKEAIHLCLKNPKDDTIYPLNLLLYIALHEIAHTMSKSYSLEEHNDEFQHNFSILLNQAEQKGYSLRGLKIPLNYCKM